MGMFTSGLKPDKLKKINLLLTIISNIGEILRNIKIQKRLIISFFVISLVPLVITGFVTYDKSSKAIESKISTYSTQLTMQVSKNTSTEVTKFEGIINELCINKDLQDGMGNFDTLDEKSKLEFNRNLDDMITSKVALSNEIKTIGIFNDTNVPISSSDTSIITKEEYSEIFSEADNADNNTVWVAINGSEDNFLLVISKSIMSISNGSKLGNITMILDAKFFSDALRDMDLGIGSDIMIINKEGIVVADKDADAALGNPYIELGLIKKITSSKQSFAMKIKGNSNLVAFSQVGTLDWYIVATIPYSFLNSESNSLRNIIILIACICLSIALVLSYIISGSISLPLKKLVGQMKLAKGGDLAIKINDNKKDELGEVFENFNEMLANISGLVKKVSQSTNDILISSEEAASLSGHAHSSSEQIALTIGEIAKGSNQQAEDISEGVQQLNSLSENINKVGNSISNVTEVIYNTKQLSEAALLSVKYLNDKALETNSVSIKIINDVNSLDKDMKQIRSIVKVIVGISEQTNLLALNAAIEAARAGEAGRGFAVVADEVKKLAVQSKESSININNIISNIQKKTETTVSEANSASEIIKKQMEAVAETDKSFKTIFTSMESVSSIIQEVDNLLKIVLRSKENTFDTINNVAAVSQESAATAVEVAASTEEQIADAEVLSNLAENLKEMAQGLNEAVSIFKVE